MTQSTPDRKRPNPSFQQNPRDAVKRIARLGQIHRGLIRGEGQRGEQHEETPSGAYTDRRTFAISIPKMQKAQSRSLG